MHNALRARCQRAVRIQGTCIANTERMKGAHATDAQRLASARNAWTARAPRIQRTASELHLETAQWPVLPAVISALAALDQLIPALDGMDLVKCQLHEALLMLEHRDLIFQPQPLRILDVRWFTQLR